MIHVQTLKNALFAGLTALALAGPASLAHAADQKLETAIVAGGCFWCIESDFDKVPGVVETVSGYAGGEKETANYKKVTSGSTKHLEAVKITYDANVISYDRILHLFWRSIDPTDAGGQFCDRGASYATAIFPTNQDQEKTAEASKKVLVASKVLEDPIVTPIRVGAKFFPAEDYHQNYHNKNPVRYKFYRLSCGRDYRVESLWGDDAWGGTKHGDS